MIAGLIAVGAVAMAVSTALFCDSAEHATARVIAIRTSHSGRTYSSLPTLQFKTVSGTTETLAVQTHVIGDHFLVGDVVPVIFDPSDPSDARLNLARHLWAAPVLMLALAIVIALVARHVASRPTPP